MALATATEVVNSLTFNLIPFGFTFIIALVVTILWIVWLFKYNNLSRESKLAKPVLPVWSKGEDSDVVVLSGSDALNKYWVQTSGGATQSLTFPPAADTVSNAPSAIVNAEYYMILNNRSGYAMNFISGTGNTLDGELWPSFLPNDDYMIVKVVLINVTAGSEQVSYNAITMVDCE